MDADSQSINPLGRQQDKLIKLFVSLMSKQ